MAFPAVLLRSEIFTGKGEVLILELFGNFSFRKPNYVWPTSAKKRGFVRLKPGFSLKNRKTCETTNKVVEQVGYFVAKPAVSRK
jgi:hypothetical protein